MIPHTDLDACSDLDEVASSMVESVRHVLEDHVASAACICGLPKQDGGRWACDDVYDLLDSLLDAWLPHDTTWLTDFVARWPVVWTWADDQAGAPSDLTDYVRAVIRYDLSLRVQSLVFAILDAKARQIGLPADPPIEEQEDDFARRALADFADEDLRVVLAAVTDALTTGTGWLVLDDHGRLQFRPSRDAVLYQQDPVEGHDVTLGYTTLDDGVHLSCSCGWDHNLGTWPDVPSAVRAAAAHLAAPGPTRTLSPG